MNITATLQSITDAFAESDREINDGLCYSWAEIVASRFANCGHDVQIWLADDSVHAFVNIDGLYYDSECLTGVEDYHDLPLFGRLPSYCPAWQIKSGSFIHWSTEA